MFQQLANGPIGLGSIYAGAQNAGAQDVARDASRLRGAVNAGTHNNARLSMIRDHLSKIVADLVGPTPEPNGKGGELRAVGGLLDEIDQVNQGYDMMLSEIEDLVGKLSILTAR